MEKENIIRSIFWGFILFIFLGLGITGVYYNNKIYNNYKDELISIINIFNNKEIIKNYKLVNNPIEASLDGKKIKVTSTSVETKEYIFKLKNGYLTTTLNNSDSIGKNIVMALTDSIAVLKGNLDGNTYYLFNNNDVLSFKLSDGIEYEKDSDNYNIKISLINPVINHVEQDKEENLDNEITEDQNKNNNDNDDNNLTQDENIDNTLNNESTQNEDDINSVDQRTN